MTRFGPFMVVGLSAGIHQLAEHLVNLVRGLRNPLDPARYVSGRQTHRAETRERLIGDFPAVTSKRHPGPVP
jgi:hypothetical protein